MGLNVLDQLNRSGQGLITYEKLKFHKICYSKEISIFSKMASTSSFDALPVIIDGALSVDLRQLILFQTQGLATRDFKIFCNENFAGLLNNSLLST